MGILKILKNIRKRFSGKVGLEECLKGENVYCAICNKSFLTFLPFGNKKRANAQCPSCNSLERHRLQFMYLKEKTDLLTSRELKILHIAPEQELYKIFKSLAECQYFPIDKFTEGYNYPTDVLDMDILNLKFDSNYFDYIFCNHVLEHIPDDQAAMKELFRVLKPNGKAFLQVPINLNFETTYENKLVFTPEDRIKHYGQFDHVRWYGQDYGNLLEKAGFIVSKINFIEQLGDNAQFKYGLMEGEELFIASK